MSILHLVSSIQSIYNSLKENGLAPQAHGNAKEKPYHVLSLCNSSTTRQSKMESAGYSHSDIQLLDPEFQKYVTTHKVSL